MKTPMEIFKKHGAHYYENDEQAIIDAMTEYAEQQVKNLNIPDVVGRSEQLKAFADYVQGRMWEGEDKDLSEFVEEFLSL